MTMEFFCYTLPILVLAMMVGINDISTERKLCELERRIRELEQREEQT